MPRYIKTHDALRRDLRYRGAPVRVQWLMWQLLELADDGGVIEAVEGYDILGTLLLDIAIPEAGDPREVLGGLLEAADDCDLARLGEGSVVVAQPRRPLGQPKRPKPSDSREARQKRKDDFNRRYGLGKYRLERRTQSGNAPATPPQNAPRNARRKHPENAPGTPSR